ncbi:hypothetical protein Tco_1496935, partial [Tanacetum coccineum]
GSKVEGRLVHLRMEVKFKVLIEKQKSARPRWDSGQLHKKSGGHSEEIRDL